MTYTIGLILLIMMALLLLMIYEAHRNKIVHSSVLLEHLPIGFHNLKIFFISDIHKRTVSDKIINEAKNKVDFVIIGGDLAESGVPIEKVKDNVVRICSIAPTYFVWGNNDYEANFREIDACLLENGVKILDNTSITFESEDGELLNLLGIDDISRGRHNLPLAIEDSQEGFKILASHDPAIEKSITKEQNIGLVLSGHTHGGQIRLFGFGIAQKGGLYDQGYFKTFISNGYGTTKFPLRLGAPAETHIITLKSKT
jgi:uncharacterized protein